MKVLLTFLVLWIGAGSVSAQVRLPVAGQDTPVPRLLATPDPWRPVRVSTPLGSFDSGRGYTDDERFDRGIWIVEFVIRADGRTEDAKFLRWGPSVTPHVLERIRTRVYEPVVFEGAPRPVLMVEFIQRVFSEDELLSELTSIARDGRLPAYARRMAIADLPSFFVSPAKRDAVTSALASLETDPDETVRRAALDAAGAWRPLLVAGIDVPAPRRIAVQPVGYPAMARAARIQGVVPVSVVVGPSGRPLSVVPVLRVPELDQAAVEAVYQWRYDPTSVAGRAVSVQLTESVSFFVDERGAYEWSSKTATDSRVPQVARLAAIDSLYRLAPARADAVRRVLAGLVIDNDLVVAAEARKRLERIGPDALRPN